MDGLERLLAEEFRSGGDLRLDSDQILSGVRRRRQRRTLLAAAAGATVLLLLGGVGYAATRDRDDSRPAVPDPERSEAVHHTEPPPPYLLVEADFSDPAHGYAMWLVCEQRGPVTERGCGYRWQTTTDGGKTWQPGRPPPVPGFVWARVEVTPVPQVATLPGGGIVVDEDPYTSPDHVRWFSDDGGRTWQERTYRPRETIAEAPTGSGVYVWPHGDHEADFGRLTVIRPDGTAAWLGDKTPRFDNGEMVSVRVTEASDGNLWVDAEHDSDAASKLTVSRDRGRSWTQVALPQANDARVLTNDGQTVYAAYPDDSQGADLLRSTDGGRHWAAVKGDEGPVPGVVTQYRHALLRDGTVLRTAVDVEPDQDFDQRVHVLRNGTYESIPGSPQAGLLGVVGARVVAVSYPTWFSQKSSYWHSPDGVHWTRFAPPG
ncbi:MAG: hypothetical protein ACRDT4_13890 [Micromonosporaceae bacterium]